MTRDTIGPLSGRAALTALLNRVPDAIVVALAPNSARVPLPADECFQGVATLPEGQGTFIDVVVPDDRLRVAALWEQAQVTGSAGGIVRASNEPERSLHLTFIDARGDLGVWLTVLASDGQWQSARRGPVLDVSSLRTRRPRSATLSKNLYAVITEIDDRTTQMLGWAPEQMVGRRSLEFVHPDDHERAIAQWLEIRTQRGKQRVRLRHQHRDGSWLWLEVENSFIGNDDPQDATVVTTITDISDEMAAHEAVRQRERLFHRLAESLPSGLFVLAADRSIIFANNRLSDTLGVKAATTLDSQLATVIDGDRQRLQRAFAEILDGRPDVDSEVEIYLPETGVRRRCLFTLAALSDDEGLSGAIVSVTDITANTLIRDDLTFRATFDPLTGCHNRASVLNALEHTLAEANDRSAVVVFLDLDEFKSVNDSYGHAVGDRLLIEVAHRLNGVLREQDTLGRLGGDEFLIICPHVGSADQATAIGWRIENALKEKISISGHVFVPAASIGIALASIGCATDEVISCADVAMYESKRQGGGKPILFSAELRLDRPAPVGLGSPRA